MSDVPQLAHPAEDAQHRLLLLYKTEGGWVCVFMTPARISLKEGDKVILTVSSFFTLAITFSHRKGRVKKKKKGKKRTMKSKEMEGGKQVEVQCNT